MAKDIIHGAVKNALIKDGWTITADPYRIEFEEFTLFADLAAQRVIGPDQVEHKVIIEVKSFIGWSFVEDLQKALGQYAMYHRFLEQTAPDYELHLAISDTTHQEYFEQKAVQVIMQAYQLTLLIVNLEREEIVAWIS